MATGGEAHARAGRRRRASPVPALTSPARRRSAPGAAQPGARIWSDRRPAARSSILLGLLVGAIVILGSELLLAGSVSSTGSCRSRPTPRCIEGARSAASSAIVNTLVYTAPLVLGGLSVAFGFKAGLFNIGAQGQFLVGALGAVIVGSRSLASRRVIAIPLAVARRDHRRRRCGASSRASSRPSRAPTRSSRTIMLNYVAVRSWPGRQRTAQGAQARRRRSPTTWATRRSRSSSATPATSGSSIALAMVFAVRWLLYRTTSGFEIRTVGANPDAARYAGMRPKRLIVLTMIDVRRTGGPGGDVHRARRHPLDDELVRDDRRLRLDRGGPARPLEPDRDHLLRRCCSARCGRAPA